METTYCTKIIIFSTRFSCDNLAVEDFVTLPIGEKMLLVGKCFVWARFRQYIYDLLPVCGGDTKFKLPKTGNSNVLFLASG